MIALAALVSVLLLLARDAACADEFVYAGFAVGSVATTGAAAVLAPSGPLRLTNDTKEAFGHGFHPAPLRFRDASTSAPVSFSTTFVVAIAPRYPDAHGHGIAFALAPSIAVPGAVAGKYLGLFNTSDSLGNGTSLIFVVELDTAMDAEFDDADENHVGIDVNGLRSVNSTPAGYWHDDGFGGTKFDNISLTGGGDAPLQVWIEYDGASARLEVTMSPAGAPRPAVPLVSCHVNLSSAVADDTYVGFSAANGAAASSHYVLGWSFRLGGGRAQDLDLSKLPRLRKYILEQEQASRRGRGIQQGQSGRGNPILSETQEVLVRRGGTGTGGPPGKSSARRQRAPPPLTSRPAGHCTDLSKARLETGLGQQ